MICIKDSSVKMHDLCPQIVLAIMVADGVYRDHYASITITSLNDGKHSPASLHYIGHAVDLRTKMFDEDEAALVAEEIGDLLGSEFDVLFEKTHIHIEYQPKR